MAVKPESCRRCGEALEGGDPQHLRHQVWEIPEIQPLVTEYQLHRLTCPCCHESSCGRLPAGVPSGQAGPRLVALVALLMGCFKQSKRRVALFLEQVLNQPCSACWVVKLQDPATAALASAYEELAAQLPSEPVLGIDESPTKQARAKPWLWTFCGKRCTRSTSNSSARTEQQPSRRTTVAPTARRPAPGRLARRPPPAPLAHRRPPPRRTLPQPLLNGVQFTGRSRCSDTVCCPCGARR